MRRLRGWIVWVVFAAALSAGFYATFVASSFYGSYRGALAARDDLQGAQALLRDRSLDATTCDLAYAEAQLADAEAGFRHARQTFDSPLLQAGRHVPLMAGSLRATTALADIGLEGVRLGHDAVGMTRAYQQQRDGGGGPLPQQMKQILEDIDPWMIAMRERLNNIQEERDRVLDARLPSVLVTPIRDMDDDLAELDELIRTYEDLSTFLPDFLGFNGVRTYLLLAQNNGELLPAGGLISVYGVISISDGRIQEMHFGDAMTFGVKWLERTGSYVEPPAPLKRYLLKDVSWNLAVANWSPHFPTAAQDADRFFRLAGGQPVDGVIAINIHTIEELLRVTGPVRVDSYDVTVSADSAFDVIEQHTRTAPEPDGERKALVGLLADEMFSRLMRLPSAQWTSLMDALDQLRSERQVAFFSYAPTIQMLSHRLELDGALVETNGDYIMLVDASVHSTKLNIALEQSIDLAVNIDGRGGAHHELRVSYSNNLPQWSAGRDPLLVRRLMLDGLYGGYVRLLTPAASQLESVTLAGREVGPEEIATEQGKESFGRYLALASGEETELAFTYTTFRVVQPDGDLLTYSLILQKQPGTGAIPVRLRLDLPEATSLDSAELDGVPVEALALIETDLAEDREIIVRYRLNS